MNGIGNYVLGDASADWAGAAAQGTASIASMIVGGFGARAQRRAEEAKAASRAEMVKWVAIAAGAAVVAVVALRR